MTESFTCLNCCAHRATKLYAGCPDYYLGTPFKVDYVTCGDCGLVQQSPIPGDVRLFYRDYPLHKARSGLSAAARRLVLRDLYRGTSDLAAGTVVLDYGCGNGSYLESLLGRQLELIGLELDARQAAEVAERLGVRVYGDPDRLVEDHRGRVGVLTMHHVLEHVTDLDGAFARVSALLRPGGEAFIVTPNVSSWEGRIFGRRWHGLDPPRHISFPDARVVDHLARRHGMTLRQTRPVAFPSGVAGSVPAVFVGRFSYPLFLACLPFGLALSRLVPSGCTAFRVFRDA